MSLLRIVLPLLAVLAGLWTAFDRGWDMGRVDLQGQHDREALDREREQRRGVRILQGKIDGANQRYAQLATRHAADVAAAERTVARLRMDIEAYATGERDADITSCRDRARALGGLLGEALQVSSECARDGELDRAAARALYDTLPDEGNP